VNAMRHRSRKDLKEPRKSREEEQRIDVNEPKPSQDQYPASNAKEVDENSKKSTCHYHIFLVD